jgi:hypothetical protein
MADNSARTTTLAQFAARAGDRGTIPVTIVKDWGDVLQVENVAAGIGGGTMRTLFWVARRDFVPAPSLAP